LELTHQQWIRALWFSTIAKTNNKIHSDQVTRTVLTALRGLHLKHYDKFILHRITYSKFFLKHIKWQTMTKFS